MINSRTHKQEKSQPRQGTSSPSKKQLRFSESVANLPQDSNTNADKIYASLILLLSVSFVLCFALWADALEAIVKGVW